MELGPGAKNRESRLGLEPEGARPATEEYSLSAEDLEAWSEAVQAIQSSNASADVKERVAAWEGGS
eukprot:SAG11_NODE_3128_length_2665_cov_1.692518_2_plen_66_part_00